MSALVQRGRSHLQTHGWWVSPLVIPQQELDALDAAINAFHDGVDKPDIPDPHNELLGEPLAPKPFRDEKPSDGAAVCESFFAVQRSQEIMRFARLRVVNEIAAGLLDVAALRIYSSTIIEKYPRSDAEQGLINWHADIAYTRNASQPLLSAWIPLQDTDERSGGLIYADGSHLWPATPQVNEMLFERSFHTQDAESQASLLRTHGQGFNPVSSAVRRGCISFHTQRVFHTSPGNTASFARRVLVLEFQPGHNEFDVAAYRAGAYVHQNDRWCRRLPDGRPDYADPFYCPATWPTGSW